MGAQAADPFQGAVQRHVLADDQRLLDLEHRAALSAIERAGVDPHAIDVLLTCSTPQDYQLTNSACELHERLGLPRACFSLLTEGAQHAFLLQLTIAETMILAGQAKTALLVQSSASSRLLDYADPISPVFGDGATAVVVGPVAGERGILAVTHNTDGRLPNTLIASVPGKRWYDEGLVRLHLADPVGMYDILLRTVDLSRESIEEALRRAGVQARDVDVFAMHQGQPWLRQLVQHHTRLEHARTIETFTATGHLFGAFVPSTLYAGVRDGILRDGDLVVIAGGGNGMTYGAAVVRWGAR
jgi:3-oxoacyl-[acyl-carrier-protein] synthase-3